MYISLCVPPFLLTLPAPTLEKNSTHTKMRLTFFSGIPRRFSPRGSLSTWTPSLLRQVRRVRTHYRVTLLHLSALLSEGGVEDALH